MSVYIDDLIVCLQSRNWPYAQACHLVADSVKELHSFAGRIGLHRGWFQSESVPHYDLTAGKRAKAVRFGAIEIGREKFAKIMRKYRPRRAGL